MYPMLQHAHSGLRWVLLLLLLVAVVNAFRKRSNREYTSDDHRVNLFTMITTHIQLLLGLILYFISPLVQFSSATMKDTILRFYTVEHLTGMLIAIALITIGYSKAKRRADSRSKFNAIAVFYGIGLLIILLSIPWPFRIPGAGWF